MATISDTDRNVFREAVQTTLANFAPEEHERIGAMASELQTILTAAKKREQEKFGKAL
jgi:hypothetical protein